MTKRPLFLAFAFLLLALPAGATTWTVTSSTWGFDVNVGDGICDGGGGVCTFPAAIDEANAHAGSDTIAFAIGTGVQTVTSANALLITDDLTIDATTQPGYGGTPLIRFTQNGGVIYGLRVIGGASLTLKGMAVVGFSGAYGAALDFTGAGESHVEGNYFGIETDGVTPNGNWRSILVASGSTDIFIGGTTAAQRNVISGGTAYGIQADSASAITIEGNYIGTNAAGTAAVGNATGIAFLGAGGSVIGGTAAGAGNVISGNATGIDLGYLGSGLTIQGNFIGLNAAGTAAVPNGTGIHWSNFSDVTIGGTTAAARNVISGNTDFGIDANTYDNGTIEGNYVGLNATGTSAVGNGIGIEVGWGTGVSVGGTAAGAGNVISGNTVGLRLFGVQNGVMTVAGNYVGTNASGTAAVGNTTGVELNGAIGQLIGGTTAAARNVISGNTTGILLSGWQNTITGNYVGPNATNTSPIGNGTGIVITSDQNLIGGTAAGAGNVISGNLGAGISATAGTGNVFTGNSIVANGGLGIDLGGDGVTPNDFGDADQGPNGRQNFPVISGVVVMNDGTHVTGTLDAPDSQAQYTLEFYGNAACDSSGYGEGEAPLMRQAVTPGAFDVVVPGLAPGTVVTATATGAQGTSEFSACANVVVGADLTVTKTADVETAKPGDVVTYTIVVSNAGPAVATAVNVDDTLPAGLELVSATATGGGSCGSASPVVCTFATLGVGGSQTVTIKARVANAAGETVNRVKASADQGDSTPAAASAAVVVQATIPSSSDGSLLALGILLAVAAGVGIRKG